MKCKQTRGTLLIYKNIGVSKQVFHKDKIDLKINTNVYCHNLELRIAIACQQQVVLLNRANTRLPSRDTSSNHIRCLFDSSN